MTLPDAEGPGGAIKFVEVEVALSHQQRNKEPNEVFRALTMDALQRIAVSSLVVLLSASIMGVTGVFVGQSQADMEETDPLLMVFPWVVALYAIPGTAVLGYMSAWRSPRWAGATAFAAQFAATAALTTTLILFATSPSEMALTYPIYWTVVVGIAIAGAGVYSMLACGGAWALAHASLAAKRRTERVRSLSIPVQAPPVAQAVAPVGADRPTAPQAVVYHAPREQVEESISIAKQRLAHGEITKQDYDELIQRLRA